MPFNKDFEAGETWHVGDTINAETWTNRVYDPLVTLLRRPLTIVRRTTDLSVGAASGAINMTFNTIDKDDDGMVIDDIAAANVADFYAQRDGVYSVYFTVTFESTTHQEVDTVIIYIYINGVQQASQATPIVGASTASSNWRCVTSHLNLAEGDILNFKVNNTDTSAINSKAQFNAPRACILWLRPLGG